MMNKLKNSPDAQNGHSAKNSICAGSAQPRRQSYCHPFLQGTADA
jgi:hypothetical protein